MANTKIQKAIWEGDTEKLHELAPCGCCCHEHFHEDCPARVWEGCRGQGSLTRLDVEAWAKFYGMTVAEFYGDERSDG